MNKNLVFAGDLPRQTISSRAAAGQLSDQRPGQFKEAANQAGQTPFVATELVKGTLLEGFKRIADLDTAREKAVYAAFVASEVHPYCIPAWVKSE